MPGTGLRGHLGVWGEGGDSAVQSHSVGRVRGTAEGHTHTHTGAHTGTYTRMLPVPFSDLELISALHYILFTANIFRLK